MTEDAAGSEPAEKAAQPPVSTVSDEQLIAMLVDRARSEGLRAAASRYSRPLRHRNHHTRRRHRAGSGCMSGRRGRRSPVPAPPIQAETGAPHRLHGPFCVGTGTSSAVATPTPPGARIPAARGLGARSAPSFCAWRGRIPAGATVASTASSPPSASRSLPPRCGRFPNSTASNPHPNATARPGPASSAARRT